MSSTDRVKYSYIPEVTPGVTPNNAAMKALRITSESLKAMFETAASAELDPLGIERDQIIIGASNSGNLNHELLWDGQDDFIAAVLRNPYVVQVDPKIKIVENGNTMPYFTFLKQFQDLGTGINHAFKGTVVDSWALSIKKKSIVTGVFSLKGMSFVNGAVIGTVLGGGTPTFPAATNTDPFNGANHIRAITIDDVPFTSCIDNINLNFNNNIRPQECLGSQTPTAFTPGTFMLTGGMDMYFKDELMFNRYKAGTAFKLNIGLTDDIGNKLDFELPRVKFEDMEVVAGGKNQDVLAKGTFRAFWDPVSLRVVKITSTSP